VKWDARFWAWLLIGGPIAVFSLWAVVDNTRLYFVTLLNGIGIARRGLESGHAHGVQEGGTAEPVVTGFVRLVGELEAQHRCGRELPACDA
jgi:hypothetical protein